MKVLITGSTGLIGSALVHFLIAKGYVVTRLTRSKTGGKSQPELPEIYWNPALKSIDVSQLEGYDTVVHLAGENIAGRWTEEKKDKLRSSRVDGTRLLSESLVRLKQPPKTLICASAVGYYGNRGSEILIEESDSGRGFLAEVCREWEAAAKPAIEKGIRVVYLRFGLVLSSKGGALEKMLIPFRMGLGGKVGSGNQYWSWIAIDDVIGAVYNAIQNSNMKGPMNVVAPNPVTNREFTETLGRVLERPTLVPVPVFVARLVFGEEMADELFLSSARVEPKRLLAAGYKFQYSNLEGALRHLLRKNKN